MQAASTRSITLADVYYLTVVALIHSTPRAAQPLVISSLATAAYQLSKRKRAAIEKNLHAAFGSGLSAEQKDRIVRGTFYAFWRELFDWSLPPLDVPPEWSGIEHLQAARQNGNGVILWESNGFGKRILPKRMLHANGFALCQIHGAKNLGGFLIVNHSEGAVRMRLKQFFDSREARFTQEILYLPTDDSFAFTRTLLTRLRDNAILVITGDGRVGQKFMRVPFLGQSVSFASGMVSLARLAGAPILPLFCNEMDNGNVCLTIEPPLALDCAQDRATATRLALTHYACLLEKRIREYPEQYRNWHLV